MNASEDAVFLITREGSLPLNYDNSLVLSYEGKLEENILGVLAPCICTKCNTPNILFSLDGSDIVEIE